MLSIMQNLFFYRHFKRGGFCSRRLESNDFFNVVHSDAMKNDTQFASTFCGSKGGKICNSSSANSVNFFQQCYNEISHSDR